MSSKKGKGPANRQPKPTVFISDSEDDKSISATSYATTHSVAGVTDAFRSAKMQDEPQTPQTPHRKPPRQPPPAQHRASAQPAPASTSVPPTSGYSHSQPTPPAPSRTRQRFEAYVVTVGYKPGLYTNWHDTHAAYSGFPNQCYKGYRTLAEAERVWQAWQDKNAGDDGSFWAVIEGREPGAYRGRVAATRAAGQRHAHNIIRAQSYEHACVIFATAYRENRVYRFRP